MKSKTTEERKRLLSNPIPRDEKIRIAKELVAEGHTILMRDMVTDRAIRRTGGFTHSTTQN